MNEAELMNEYKKHSDIIVQEIKALNNLKLNDEDEEKIKLPLDEELYHLGIKIGEIRMKILEFEETSKKAMGQLYRRGNGILLKNELSVRNGNIYYFRRSYCPPLNRLLEKIFENIEEINKKISPEGIQLLYDIKKLFEDIKSIDYQSKEVINLDEPLVIFNLEYRRSNEYGQVEEASSIEIDEKGIKILNDRGYDTLEERRYTLLIYNKFKKEIDEAFERYKCKINSCLDNVNKINETLQRKGGKYLIAANI